MSDGNIVPDVTQQTSLAIGNQLNRVGNVEWRRHIHGVCPQPSRFGTLEYMERAGWCVLEFAEKRWHRHMHLRSSDVYFNLDHVTGAHVFGFLYHDFDGDEVAAVFGKQ